MVVEKDFLIRIKTMSNEELLRLLNSPNLTEEQRQVIREELSLRGIENVNQTVYTEEVNMSPIIANIKWVFEKYQIPQRLGIESYQLEGFMNPEDYIILLRNLMLELKKRNLLTWSMEQDLLAIINMIKNLLGRGEENLF